MGADIFAKVLLGFHFREEHVSAVFLNSNCFVQSGRRHHLCDV